MTPTNEQVRAACQRAGIPVIASGRYLYIDSDDHRFCLDGRDNDPGSALFIVAVLGALPMDWELARSAGTVRQWYFIVPNKSAGGWDPEGCADTLTAACMAAIVAAFAPVENKE